jgi:hypothetical protein
MDIPSNAKIIDWPTSVMWFDEDGILYSVAKPNAPREQSREESVRQMEEFRKIIGGKKTCMVTETNGSAPPPKKEDRDWIAAELNSVVKAMAIISTSPFTRMVASLFFGFKPPAYPYKFCANETEAREWIKQYL